jgi:hypothetical protein
MLSTAPSRHDLGRTRAYKPRLRRPMPYPLGHKAFYAIRRSSDHRHGKDRDRDRDRDRHTPGQIQRT